MDGWSVYQAVFVEAEGGDDSNRDDVLSGLGSNKKATTMLKGTTSVSTISLWARVTEQDEDC